MSLKKDVRQIIDKLTHQGWKVSITGGDHFKLIPPQKCYGVQFISNTPSDNRAIKNIKSQLRKAGANL